MKKHLLIILLLFIGTVTVYPQIRTVGSDSERNAEYKKAIGLDMTVPDFDTNKIDAKVMGPRLANLLNYLLENYNHESYELLIAQILGKQNESLQHLYYKIKKLQFANASKQGDVMTVLMHVWPDKNIADVDQADLMFRFVDGVSDDQTTNALFSYMSRYVDAQEAIYLQEDVTPENSNAIVTNSFWDNWYAQVGVDMNLMFPVKHKIKDVFPNGKSFGVNVAVGKWFSPEFGGRFKVVWNNGILSNDYNTWLAPYGVPGENHRQGGFLNFIWDVQVNMHNLVGTYKPDRKWNLIVAPRAGGYWDFGTTKGCPILGVGVINTYRFSSKWSIFLDAGYHFVASINGTSSGRDHGGNSFAEINVGVQYDFRKKNHDGKWQSVKEIGQDEEGACLNHFWDNWFIQAGVGMSLINPYGTNFANVFPNGNTLGINLGLGKWFSPEAGVRGGFNWQNGIIPNKQAHYLDSEDGTMQNYKKHGFVSLYADLFMNLHHIIGGYSKNKIWNAIVYPRMGLAVNFSSTYSECPLLGIGTEQTFVLNKRLKLFADVSYQVTTSGFLDARFHTGNNGGLNTNGWFDLNVGIQYELGQVVGWDKPGERRTSSVVASSHNWPRFIVNTGASVVVAYGVKAVLKKVVKEERPDHSDNKSFPSGHASMAFAAARSIDKEFRKDCIWIPIAGYAAATAIGVERVVNKHHHWYDVVAGAGIGFGSAELTWWLSDLMFGKGRNVAIGSSGNTLDVTYSF